MREPTPGGSIPDFVPSPTAQTRKKKKSGNSGTGRPSNSEAILQLALELLAVSLFTLMAGTSDEMGKLMILFMVGFWLIYLIQNSKVIAGLERMLEAA